MPRLLKSDPNYGRTLGSSSSGGFSSQFSGSAAPAQSFQPVPQQTSTTSYQQAPGPQLDPYASQRSAAMMQQLAGADPYEKYRSGYLDQLKQMTAGGAGSFTPSDPSYAFRFKQGQSALESSLAARGLLGSGGAALELQQYGQEAGAQEFGAQFQRLQQLAGMGDPLGAAQARAQAAGAAFETYQPQMLETGRTQFGFPGLEGMYSGGGAGGGVSGRGGGRSSGAGRPPKSAVAELLNRAAGTQFQRTNNFEMALMAARAQDAAAGFESLPGFGGRGGGGMESRSSPSSTYERNIASNWAGSQGKSRRSPYDPDARYNRMQDIMRTGGKGGGRMGGNLA